MTPGELFKTGRKKKREKPPTDPVVAAALKHLMFKVYYPLYKARFGEAPPMPPRDWAALKRLITVPDGDPIEPRIELVEQRIRQFVAWEGPGSPMTWERPSGYTLSLLENQWATLTLIQHRQQQRAQGASAVTCRHQPRCETAAQHTSRENGERRTGPMTTTKPAPSRNGSSPTT